MTVATWSESYLQLEQVKKQHALNRTRQFITVINRHVGNLLLTEIKREHLFRFRNERLQEHLVRAGKEREKTISLGTVANEISCLKVHAKQGEEMHQRYVNLKSGDVAKAFGIVEDCSQAIPKDVPAKQSSSVI